MLRDFLAESGLLSALEQEIIFIGNRVSGGLLYLLQGPSWQSVFFKLTDVRKMQVRFFLKVVLKSWDLIFLGTTMSFHEMLTVRLLLDQM